MTARDIAPNCASLFVALCFSPHNHYLRELHLSGGRAMAPLISYRPPVGEKLRSLGEGYEQQFQPHACLSTAHHRT